MLWVIATITTTPGNAQNVLDALLEVAPTVQQEEGCLRYQPAIDAPRGLTHDDTARSDTVTVIETWSSRAALEAHMDTPHMARFRDATADWVTHADIRLIDPVDA
ncbi:antibiotic biosynthesis monooxygenase [Halomonas sp. DP8Y7-1]|uniref:putative quinol monooxygenase n=1 Tax=Halomonas TaxID=2745 RepID=UPI001A8CAC45|nr:MULTISPECIES: putative quinol monooxygenase [Halomonas]MBN8413150.1 antibiotic biosynthesis monooxygenase [Halomonas litopenaei]MBY6029503.1 antibiotic biosynthesis monooxygenase [Halomonas sp. DP8Y7-1]